MVSAREAGDNRDDDKKKVRPQYSLRRVVKRMIQSIWEKTRALST
jgi:hypothetical protein